MESYYLCIIAFLYIHHFQTKDLIYKYFPLLVIGISSTNFQITVQSFPIINLILPKTSKETTASLASEVDPFV